jgi:hypothetical protein
VSNIYDAFYNCPKLVAVSVPWQATVDRYAFGYILDQTADEDEAEYQRATGSASAYATYFTYSSTSNSLIKHYKKITPSKFTLVVEQGTDAEKYAKSNHIVYRYRLAAPESVLASRGKNKITLSWNWVNGADYYIVYLQNNLTGKYEEYDRVTSETCTVTGLRSGTKYNFRLVAVDTIDGTDIAGFTSELFEFHTR